MSKRKCSCYNIGRFKVKKFEDQNTLQYKQKLKCSDLHVAVNNYNTETLASLLKCSMHTFDVNSKDICHRTPLHYAVKQGSEHKTKLLIEYGANPHIRDNDGCTIIEIAKENAFIYRLFHHYMKAKCLKENYDEKRGALEVIEKLSRIEKCEQELKTLQNLVHHLYSKFGSTTYRCVRNVAVQTMHSVSTQTETSADLEKLQASEAVDYITHNTYAMEILLGKDDISYKIPSSLEHTSRGRPCGASTINERRLTNGTDK